MNNTMVGIPSRAAGYFRKAWWMALLEGIVAIGAGLLLLFRPVSTVVFLVQVLGVYWLISGVFHSIASLFGTREQGWWTKLLGGIALALIGVAVLAYPAFSAAVTAFTLVMFLASLAVFGGIMTMIWGFSLSSEVPGEGWTVMSGLISVVLGIALFTVPFVALRGLSILTGLFAVAGGVSQIIFGFRLRALAEKVKAKNRLMTGEYAAK